MHAYAFPEHERRAAALAREAGFTQISVSHEVAPLIKIVPRGDTTVADAYLTPVLRRYTDGIRDAFAGDLGTRLAFMASSGGLRARTHFHGRDAISVGPAGGVVGMAETARRAASIASSASTWAHLDRRLARCRAITSAPSRPRSRACACACRYAAHPHAVHGRGSILLRRRASQGRPRERGLRPDRCATAAAAC